MNSTKKALCIVFGLVFVFVGLGTTFIFIVVNNATLSAQLIGIGVGLVTAVFGWWLLRRGSENAREALSWLIANIVP
jgi:cytochrome c biogenesis protein CcdA